MGTAAIFKGKRTLLLTEEGIEHKNGTLQLIGSGSPEGVTPAPIGSLFQDTTNGKLYIKTAGVGNTGWDDFSSSALDFKGVINVPADFPLLASVSNGHLYLINSNVTDNDATKTNTGQSFTAGDQAIWNGTDWSISSTGNPTTPGSVVFVGASGTLAEDNTNLFWDDSANTLKVSGLSGVLKAATGVISGSATTTDLTEGTNLYFTDSRARAAISSGDGIDYVPGTGVVSADINTTNLKITTGEINTIQDITTTSSPTFNAITLTTDLPVSDGGTGASNASGARTNLGVAIGSDVQAWDTDLDAISGLSSANDDIIQRKAGVWTNRTVAQYKTDLALDNVTNDAQVAKATFDANTILKADTDDTPVALSVANSTFLGRKSTGSISAMSVSESKTELGAGSANGLATLDAGGKVPAAQLPNSIMDYKGNWDASTNTPTLADGVGSAGDIYKASVAGTQDLGSGNITFAIGDWAIYNGTIWEKSDNTDAVASVFGRTGAVVSANGDYTAAQVTNVASGSISSTTVQAAIDELETEKQPIDAGLTSISGLTTVADKMIYTTASDVYAVSDLTAFARTILDDTNAAGVRTTIGALADIVEDTTPQLGGMLDINGQSIGDGTLELLSFVEMGSSVNELTITNAATGANPSLSATGDDANIGINLISKGTGVIQSNGNRLLSFGAGEITTLTEKVTPADTDLIVIEDSADSNNKKKVQLSKLITNVVVEAKTNGTASPYLVVSSDDQKVFTNEGATEEVYITLPLASPGLGFTFICQDTDGLRITANTGDTIRLGVNVSAAAGNIKTFTVGNTIKLIAINSSEWFAIASTGDGSWEVT